MSDLSPGQEVTVSGMGGGVARVIYVRGNSVRVRMIAGGRERTVDLDRVTPKRESKALTISEMAMQWNDAPDMANVDETTAKRIVAACAPVMLHERSVMGRLGLRADTIPSPLRPVPKPVALYSEPYLAYVRKHPCCRCGSEVGVVPSHWGHHGASTSKKVDDYRTIPLCDPCHIGEWHRTGTFPGMSRAASEAFTLGVQRELLLAWTATRIWDGDMVDALIRAIGGADA